MHWNVLRPRLFFPISLFVLFLSACQTLYVPNQPQVPLMSQGDETQIALNIASNGYGLQLAYSPYYHWAIIANGNTFTVPQDTNFEVKYRHSYGEIGTGYYTRLNKYLRLEALAGLGFGSSGLNNDRGLYRRGFIQPSIGASTRIIDAGITTRIAWVQHFENRVNGLKTRINESVFFFEPSIMARAGYEQVKFSVQAGLSIPLGDPSFGYRNSFIGMGIHITLVKDFERYMF